MPDTRVNIKLEGLSTKVETLKEFYSKEIARLVWASKILSRGSVKKILGTLVVDYVSLL